MTVYVVRLWACFGAAVWKHCILQEIHLIHLLLCCTNCCFKNKNPPYKISLPGFLTRQPKVNTLFGSNSSCSNSEAAAQIPNQNFELLSTAATFCDFKPPAPFNNSLQPFKFEMGFCLLHKFCSKSL